MTPLTPDLLDELEILMQDLIADSANGDAGLVGEAIAEITRLRAVVANLPRTADGKPIVPGMTVWMKYTKDGAKTWQVKGPGTISEIGSVGGGITVSWPREDGSFRESGFWYMTKMGRNDFYSTRAAADAALAAAKTEEPR